MGAPVRGLLEISLQHALQSNAVASLVAGHLVDGVVDGVQAVLLGDDGQVELTLGSAARAVAADSSGLIGRWLSLHHWGSPGSVQLKYPTF